MMMNKYPGHFLLMPSTVTEIRSLKIQRKTKKNYHRGIRRFKMPSNGININNLIPVAIAGTKTRRENGCKYHFGLVNVRSIKSKEQALVNYITDKDFDIVLMTEMWLKPDKDDAWKSASCLNRNGYTQEHCDRLVNKGGCISLIYKSNLKVKILYSDMGKTFEFVVWQINFKKMRNQCNLCVSIICPHWNYISIQ